jgi:alpha-glucosidase (family GH31 glycosyl hydrolase)
MPQLESVPRAYTEVERPIDTEAPSIRLLSWNETNKFEFEFQVMGPNLFRTTFQSESHQLPPWPSVREPQSNLNDYEISSYRRDKQSIVFSIEDVTASVEWADTPIVSLGWKGASKPLHRDLESRSYVCDGPGIAHYTNHDRNALHVGLGEKAARMDLTGRHFQLSASDCFGYDVYKTDPMYKHLPLLIKATPAGCVAIFSTTHSRGSWSVGSEIDGLWGHFKVYRQDYGGIEEYLIIGRTLKEVVRTYAELVGFPQLVPRWAFGYISGGYQYCMGDDPPAHQQLLAFAEKLKEHDIPCSAHRMSSGYSISEV